MQVKKTKKREKWGEKMLAPIHPVCTVAHNVGEYEKHEATKVVYQAQYARGEALLHLQQLGN